MLKIVTQRVFLPDCQITRILPCIPKIKPFLIEISIFWQKTIDKLSISFKLCSRRYFWSLISNPLSTQHGFSHVFRKLNSKSAISQHKIIKVRSDIYALKYYIIETKSIFQRYTTSLHLMFNIFIFHLFKISRHTEII